MAKDVNIHIKTPGAGEAKQRLDEVGKAAEGVGGKTAAGQKRGADAIDKTTQKMSGMDRVLGSLKTAVLGFVGAYLGLEGVKKIITWLIEKLERIAQLQKDIYEKSLSFAQIGQALEMQTGTRGMQQYWAQQAAQLQAAGGLAGPGVAQQMMVSADIAFQAQGGIKAAQVMTMLTQLTPFIGAQQMGPEQVAKLFEFAGTAGIAPTPQAYKGFFAKLQAGYTASKATDFGQYMLGLQKGVTPYMSMGGGLEQGISAFVGARAVSPNEALAATLVEQVSRLASGAYERPRKALEQALGVRFESMTMDQRTMALLQYVGGIPEARRGQVLAAQGFPIELTSRIGMMVSPEATKAMAAARRTVGAAGAPAVDQLTQDYLQSVLGKEKVTAGEVALTQLEAAPEFADWQTRLKKSRADFDVLLARGQDRWIRDAIEPHVMALEQLLAEARAIPYEGLPEEEHLRLKMLRVHLVQSIDAMSDITAGAALFYTPGMAARRGYEYTQEFERIINIHNDYSTNYIPRIGAKDQGSPGPRMEPGVY